MKLWLDNRVDQEYDLPPAEVADRFLASPWAAATDWPIRRALSVFLAAPVGHGGLSSVWEEAWDNDLHAVVEIISAHRRSGRNQGGRSGRRD